DGTPLGAYLIQPKNSSPSNRVPLIVMPASWGSGSNEYVQIGKEFANAGYEVISYAQRGFRPSEGEVDFADTQTQGDVSTVIDWALKNTDADKNRIGMLGLSYGAGMSLLGAERDARVKAVVAMAAWADLGAAMDPNHTLNALALAGLMSSGARVGTLNPELSTVKDQLVAGVSAGSETMLNKPVRSASTNVAALNRNKTAVMLANAYQDSLIIPNQLVSFFNQLTGPKRLELRRGDHGGPEITGLLGGTSAEFQTAMHWLDHYVRGVDNGIQDDKPVQLEDVKTRQWHAYGDWAEIGRATRSMLGDANTGALPTGTIDGRATAWSRTIKTGTDTVATSGITQINSPNFILTAGVPISKVNRADAVVWTGATTPAAAVVNGEPHLHITVMTSGASGTFFAYLYDVDPATGGTLMTYAPYSVVGVTPGTPTTVDVDLGATSWTVGAGHHLALVIDTVDGRYFGHNTAPGSTLTFSSSTADPASLAVDVAG
ncbi:MAG TPA: alpha/beta fold hydrolase, partial [Jatrophihabitantaceae bacterium]|nr:alpha/beta fold hydrolase [Jatrophihabitantaceae bacterium]